jgi:hypothetical protein
MLGPNQIKSGGIGVGAGVEVRVGVRLGAATVVAVSLGKPEVVGVSSKVWGILQAAIASASRMIGLGGIMFWGNL